MKETLFKIARSRVAGSFMGFSFENMTGLMPVGRVVDTPKTIVFYHPVPQSEQHLLSVPKKSFKNLLAVDFNNPTDKEHIIDVIDSIQTAALRKQFRGYAVMVNGGKYQDVPQVHFHILSGREKSGNQPAYEQYNRGVEKGKILKENGGVTILESSDPLREFHLVFRSEGNIGSINDLDMKKPEVVAVVSNMFREIQETVNDRHLDAYTVLAINNPDMVDQRFALHLVSSKD